MLRLSRASCAVLLAAISLSLGILVASPAKADEATDAYDAMKVAAKNCDKAAYNKNLAILENLRDAARNDPAKQLVYQTMLDNLPPYDCPNKSTSFPFFPGWIPTLPGALGVISLDVSVGAPVTSTHGTFGPFFSNSVQDTGTGGNTANPSGTGVAGGVGFIAPIWQDSPSEVTLGDKLGRILFPLGELTPTRSQYAPEAKKAYAAAFPIQAAPRRQPGWSGGVDGNVYFFAGGDQKFTGIPGGPFGTATGSDSFKVSNNVMFTAGAWITAPITQAWSVSLTGGFAELNQTIKYSCSTFCAVAPATGAFTASQDKWVTGGYVGGRVTMPVAIPALPAGTNIGIDYKHVFFGSYNVALGTVATRQVNARMSPDMDLVTLRFGIPLR